MTYMACGQLGMFVSQIVSCLVARTRMYVPASSADD